MLISASTHRKRKMEFFGTFCNSFKEHDVNSICSCSISKVSGCLQHFSLLRTPLARQLPNVLWECPGRALASIRHYPVPYILQYPRTLVGSRRQLPDVDIQGEKNPHRNMSVCCFSRCVSEIKMKCSILRLWYILLHLLCKLNFRQLIKCCIFQYFKESF